MVSICQEIIKMEPDLKDEEEVAPLRVRLLQSKEADRQSWNTTSCALFDPSPCQSMKHNISSGRPDLVSEEKVQPMSHCSPKTDTEDKDDSMTSLFESSVGEELQAEVENQKDRDTGDACSVSPVFNSSCRPSLTQTVSPISLEKVTRNFGVSEAKETFKKEIAGKAKTSDREGLPPSQLQMQNGNLNFKSVDAPGINMAGKDEDIKKDPLKNFTNRSERMKEKEEVLMNKKSKREMENGDKKASVALKPKYHSRSSTPVDEDGSTTSENDGNPKRKRQEVEFNFRGLSQGDEENQQSWSRKGKLVVSKNGAAKSKVKGVGRRTLVSSTSGTGVDSCGTKSPSGLEMKSDGGEKCHHKGCEMSKSPVFGRHKSYQPECRKRKKVMPRSFNWEDDIPSICEETVETNHCKKHGSHDIKDGERHYSGTNGLCSTSQKHIHRKERFQHESNLSGHSSEDHGSRYDDIHRPNHRIRSSAFDPRFYPEVHGSGRTTNHYIPDQLKRKTIHQPDRRQERRGTLKEADPKTSPRYNKYLLRHQNRRGAEDSVETERSSRRADQAHRQDQRSKDLHRKTNHHQTSSKSRDIPSLHARAGSNSPGPGQNLNTSSRSRMDRDRSPKDKYSGRQTNQRKHLDLSQDDIAHSPKSPSSRGSQSRNVSKPDSTTYLADSFDASSTPLDLSQTSQGSRIRTKRRKTHTDNRAAVISDDEDADVILEGVSSGASWSSGTRRGERRRADHVSITEIIDDDEDDPVIILGDNEQNRTPSGHMASVHDLSDGVNITPRTAAAIQQLEADEALARRLQLEFDREEATFAPPPPQHHEYNAPPEFNHHQLLDEMVRSLTSEFSSPGGISFQFTSAMPWLNHQQQPPRPRRRAPRRNNRRGQMGHGHPTYEDGGPDDYERLLELAEHLGPAVPQGLPVEVLTRLPTFKFQEVEGGVQLKEEDRSCAICMSEYEANEELRRLPCFHAYHTMCIDKWFEQNSACPICRVRVQLD